MTKLSFKFMAQTKFVNVAILAASFHYNKLISIPEAIPFDKLKINSTTRILAKKMPRELYAHITQNYNVR